MLDSALTVDRDRESAADLAQASVGETAESLDEDADRDALNRVEVDGRTPGGSGRRRVPGRPGWGVPGLSSWTARRALAEPAGSPRRAKGQRPGAGRRRPVRTTTPHPEWGARSRCGGRPPERRQVAPLVGLVERVLVVGGVTRLQLGGAIAKQQRSQCLIDERGVVDSGAQPSSAIQEFRVYRRAEACACHAITMPRQEEARRD